MGGLELPDSHLVGRGIDDNAGDFLDLYAVSGLTVYGLVEWALTSCLFLSSFSVLSRLISRQY